jgi:Ricin-type beta-trefoil lectin domain
MLDGDELGRNGKDRVLVRPYIKEADPGSPSTQEIPVPTEPAEPLTTVLPTVPDGLDPAADAKDRRVVLWLVAAGLALVVGAAAVIIMLWPSGGHDDQAAPGPGATLPIGGAAPKVSASAASSPSVSASASPSASVTLSLPVPPAGATPSQGQASAPAPPAATLAPAPGADQVGSLTGPGGHCLAMGGLGLPGSPTVLQSCNGTVFQKWTAAADGTLRVSSECASSAGTSVQMVGCGSGSAMQWRAGPNGTLVNLAGNLCLTDPDNGAKTGGRMVLAGCGGAGQSWTLP